MLKSGADTNPGDQTTKNLLCKY